MLNKKDVLLVGVMIFAMAFGAGDIIHGLLAGRAAGCVGWTFLGYALAGIVLPLLALRAVLRFDGCYISFLSAYIGRGGAFLVALVAMLLLGPAGAIPRCGMQVYGVLASGGLIGGKVVFATLFTLLVGYLACVKSNLMRIFGRIVGPATIGLVAVFIVAGLSNSSLVLPRSMSLWSGSFWNGFYNGLFSFEILAFIFYAGVVVQIARELLVKRGLRLDASVPALVAQASWVTGLIFFGVAGGLIFVAAGHAPSISASVAGEMLFSAYSGLLLPAWGSALSSAVIVLACFSASVTLTVVVADFVASYLKLVSYFWAVWLCCAVTMAFSFFNLAGLVAVLCPVVLILHPLLIVMVLLANFVGWTPFRPAS